MTTNNNQEEECPLDWDIEDIKYAGSFQELLLGYQGYSPTEAAKIANEYIRAAEQETKLTRESRELWQQSRFN